MDNKIIHAFYGKGKGKTSAAIGQAVRDVKEGERVTIIQFLKGKGSCLPLPRVFRVQRLLPNE